MIISNNSAKVIKIIKVINLVNVSMIYYKTSGAQKTFEALGHSEPSFNNQVLILNKKQYI